jgi:hypothetical protein
VVATSLPLARSMTHSGQNSGQRQRRDLADVNRNVTPLMMGMHRQRHRQAVTGRLRRERLPGVRVERSPWCGCDNEREQD